MRGNETNLYKISDASRILGVSKAILRKWDENNFITTIRTPGGMRLFDISTIDGQESNITKVKKKEDPVIILYSRVSSIKQKDDLDRQKEFVRSNLPIQYSGRTISEVSDIGSGINFKRPGLLQVLGRVKEGKVSLLVVASRDRLARFGFELIEWLCTEFGTKILVLDNEDTTPESELGKDLMSIVQVYCCRWNGRRRYAKADGKSNEVETSANEGTETDASTLGGLFEVPVQQDNCTFGEQKEQDNEGQVPTSRQTSKRKKKVSEQKESKEDQELGREKEKDIV